LAGFPNVAAWGKPYSETAGNMSASPRFSLVIPARNEAEYLPRLLDTVDVARSNYRLGPEAVEVIVADNVSTDRTAEIALNRRTRVVQVEKRLIAAVRNAGVGTARGEVLAFLDADSQMHPDTFNAIEQCLDTGRVVGGATGVHMERMSLGIGLTYALFVPFVWITRMDTGVVFCRREDFKAVGGYNESLSFAEDVRFLMDLRRVGRSRGQRLHRLRSVKAIASTRKFDQFGDWHYLTGLTRGLFWLVFAPRSGRAFAQKYWYGDLR
jgi:glycosyltransferase involved in cell wall biosynthesis